MRYKINTKRVVKLGTFLASAVAGGLAGYYISGSSQGGLVGSVLGVSAHEYVQDYLERKHRGDGRIRASIRDTSVRLGTDIAGGGIGYAVGKYVFLWPENMLIIPTLGGFYVAEYIRNLLKDIENSDKK